MDTFIANDSLYTVWCCTKRHKIIKILNFKVLPSSISGTNNIKSKSHYNDYSVNKTQLNSHKMNKLQLKFVVCNHVPQCCQWKLIVIK